MDTEVFSSEKSQSQSLADVDSGIETMEVDETELQTENKRKRVSLCYLSTTVF